MRALGKRGAAQGEGVMNIRSNPCLAVVLHELTAAGASYTVTRNRQAKVYWELDGRKAVTVVSITSGTMAPIKARASVRRQLREKSAT